MSDVSWQKICDDYSILEHSFEHSPFALTAAMIKQSCRGFAKTGEKEVRILCKQDTREQRPEIFKQNDLFLLPTKNGEYVIIKGDGYVDIPVIAGEVEEHVSGLGFSLESSKVGNSEMQHLDFAYASSIIRTFIDDPSLVLTIRGRKYTPEFSFHFGRQNVIVRSVQTEVDAGYEGKDQIVLVEAKNSKTKNTIIRQLFYPYRQWSIQTKKPVKTVFFEKRGKEFYLWEYGFEDPDDYSSIKLVRSKKFKIN